MPFPSPMPATRSRTLWIVLGVALTIWGVVDVRRRARVDPLDFGAHKTDLTVFTGAGAAFYTNSQPYEYKNPRNWKYPYLPLLALLLAPLSVLEPQWQAMLWYAISLVFGWGCWVEGRRILEEFGVRRCAPREASLFRWTAACSIATFALPALNSLQRGQIGLLLAYLMILGTRLLVQRRSALRVATGSAAITLAATIKLVPFLPLLLASWAWLVTTFGKRGLRPSWKSMLVPAAAVGSVVLYVLVIPGLLLGHSANLQHIKTFHAKVTNMAVAIDPEGQVETPYTPANQSLSNAAYRLGNYIDFRFFGGPDDLVVEQVPLVVDSNLAMDAPWVVPVLLALRLIIVVNLIALATIVCWKDPTWDPVTIASLIGIASVASLVVSPMSRGHYFVLMLPATLSVPLWMARMRGERFARLVALAPVCLMFMHYVFLKTGAGRLGVLGLGTTAWLAIVSLSAWIHVLNNRGNERAGEASTTMASAKRLAA